jgi:hypothetical protein
MEELLSQLAGLSNTSLAQLKRTAPFVFGLPPTKVQSVLDYLFNLLDHDDSHLTPQKKKAALGKLVVGHPHLLNLGVETNLQPRVDFLSMTCGLTATDVAKLVQTSGGSILGLSVDQNLKPTMEYLRIVLHLDRKALRKCLLAHPQLLALSIANLQSKVHYFESIGGTSLASRIAYRCPAVYSLSLTDNLIPTIDFLSRAWGMTQPESSGDTLAHWLQEYPNILTMSLEGNIQPTMNFYNRTGYTGLTDNWELVAGQTRIRGRYIAASLYNRLLPRWHYCRTQSEDDTNLPLHLLATATEVTFCQETGHTVEDFVRFKEDAIPRLKFSSQFDTWLKTGRPIDV